MLVIANYRDAAENPGDRWGHIATEKLSEIVSLCTDFEKWIFMRREEYGDISICKDVERKCREISQRANQILQEPKPAPPREEEPKRVEAARCNERRWRVAGGLGR